MDEQAQLIDRILQLNKHIIDRHLGSDANTKIKPDESWLNVPLTMPQFKILLIVHGRRGGRGVTIGQLARALGVGLPTVSGIVDRLYEQQLVTRSEDPEDRRITRVEATKTGRDLVNKLYINGRDNWRLILNRLNAEELQTVAHAFELLYRASMTEEQNSIPSSAYQSKR